MADRVYSKEETEEILAHAIELHGHGEATTHAELLATAREIGVAPEALEKAAAEVLARRHDDQALRALRTRQWRGFLAHLVPFLSVGMLLGFINVMTGGFPWAVIPMLGWGIGLASHLLAVALPDEEKLRRRVTRQRERERERAREREGGAAGGGGAATSARLRVDSSGGADGATDGYDEAAADEAEIAQRAGKGSRP